MIASDIFVARLFTPGMGIHGRRPAVEGLTGNALGTGRSSQAALRNWVSIGPG